MDSVTKLVADNGFLWARVENSLNEDDIILVSFPDIPDAIRSLSSAECRTLSAALLYHADHSDLLVLGEGNPDGPPEEPRVEPFCYTAAESTYLSLLLACNAGAQEYWSLATPEAFRRRAPHPTSARYLEYQEEADALECGFWNGGETL